MYVNCNKFPTDRQLVNKVLNPKIMKITKNVQNKNKIPDIDPSSSSSSSSQSMIFWYKYKYIVYNIMMMRDIVFLLVVVVMSATCILLAAVFVHYNPSNITTKDYYDWSSSCPIRTVFFSSVLSLSSPLFQPTNTNNERRYYWCCCSVTDYGAVGDNTTLNTYSIQQTIDKCCSEVVTTNQDNNDAVTTETTTTTTTTTTRIVIYVPPGNYKTGSILLSRSNIHLHIGKGAAIYGSTHPIDYPIVDMLPNGYPTGKTGMFRALISTYNVTNITITGENTNIGPVKDDNDISIVDGVGWKWWCWTRYVKIIGQNKTLTVYSILSFFN